MAKCKNFFPQSWSGEGILVKAPELLKLVINSVHIDIFDSLLRDFPNLVHLDLSDCIRKKSDCVRKTTGQVVRDLKCLYHCPNLTTLILYNVSGLQGAIHTICKQVALR